MTTVPPRTAGFFGELILNPASSRKLNQSRRLPQGFRANIFNADFIDDFVTRARRIHRGDVRSAVEESKHAVGIFVFFREFKRILMRRPSGHARLQFRPQIAAHVQIPAPGPPHSHFTDPPVAKSTPNSRTFTGTVRPIDTNPQDSRADLVCAPRDRGQILN